MQYNRFTRISRALTYGVKNYLIDKNYTDDILSISEHSDSSSYVTSCNFSSIYNDLIVPEPQTDTRTLWVYFMPIQNISITNGQLVTADHKMLLMKRTTYGDSFGNSLAEVDMYLMSEFAQYFIHHLIRMKDYPAKVKYVEEDASTTFKPADIINNWDNFNVNISLGLGGEAPQSNYYVRALISSKATLNIRYR